MSLTFLLAMIMTMTLSVSHSNHWRVKGDGYDPLYGKIGDLIIKDEDKLAYNIKEAIEHGIENEKTQGK